VLQHGQGELFASVNCVQTDVRSLLRPYLQEQYQEQQQQKDEQADRIVRLPGSLEAKLANDSHSAHSEETPGTIIEGRPPRNESTDDSPGLLCQDEPRAKQSRTLIRSQSEVSSSSYDSYGSRLNHEDSWALKELTKVFDSHAVNTLSALTPKERSPRFGFIKSRLTKAEVVDIIAGFVIILNAISMGMSMDSPHSDEGVWLAISITFALLFWVELVVKASLLGCRQQYWRDGSISNIFDAALIFTDTAHIVLSLMKTNFPTASYMTIFRIIRLMRLARLLRLFRAPMFADLLAMIHGLMFGMATLAWSLVFFIVFIYVMALVFRASLGPEPGDQDGLNEEDGAVGWYFQTVPRSMLTTFRCSFGDCSTARGTPIFEAPGVAGAMTGLMLSCLVFIASVGLFNIISAVFIERIMEYASANLARKMHQRLRDKNRWRKNVMKLLRALLRHAEETSVPMLQNMDIHALREVSFSRSLLNYAIENDDEVMEILAELDIDPQDYFCLPETIDSNNAGFVKATEIISGLSRLRGTARRSDIVTVDLMIRSLQKKMDDLWCSMKDCEKRSCSSLNVQVQRSLPTLSVDQQTAAFDL